MINKRSRVQGEDGQEGELGCQSKEYDIYAGHDWNPLKSFKWGE